MLFPPPGVKLRRTLETQLLTSAPTMIAGHDPRRVLLAVMGDGSVSLYVAFAGSRKGLDTAVYTYFYAAPPVTFVGAEEVWAKVYTSGTPTNGNILIQSVFYD